MKLLSLVLATFILLYGCGKRDMRGKIDVIARVNKDVIYRSDLKKEIALRAKFDPTFRITPDTERNQLDVMINRKLIIQEAMEKGFARKERFVDTIQKFWEQTLIRDFVDSKKEEFKNRLTVTDNEINEYYENLKKRVTFKVLEARDRQVAEEAYKKYIRDKDTSGWQSIGPVTYGDISSNVLFGAFKMGEGEARIIEERPSYYLVAVTKKEDVAIEPLDSLRSGIAERVAAMKERRLFEDWLKEKRENSKITINKELQ